MSEDRLDRLEKIVESNSKAIEAWANESVEFRNRMEATTERIGATTARIVDSIERLEATTARIVDSIELLTQVVIRLEARQQDQENRLNRLEQ
jgi:archaellum component FlaC